VSEYQKRERDKDSLLLPAIHYTYWNMANRFHYSRAWQRLQFRARSWINRRGGDTWKIASRILNPFLRDLQHTHGAQSWKQVHEAWRNVLNRTILYGGCSEYNEIEVFHEGGPMFNQLWKDIDSAKKRIWIDTYTLKNDYTGMKTIAKLTKAAKRGCEVVIITDAWGSMGLLKDQAFLQPLLDAGGHFYMYNLKHMKIWKIFIGSHPTRSPWLRNHRKLIIIDDVVAYCGGMNIADEYSGKNIILSKQLPSFKNGEINSTQTSTDYNGSDEELISDYAHLKNYPKMITEADAKEKKLPFRDTHARLTGPCVNYLSNAFMESLEEVAPGGKFDYSFPDLFAIAERKYLEKNRQKQEAINQSKESASTEYDAAELEETLNPLEMEEEQNLDIDRGTFIQVLTSHPRHARKHLDRALHNVISHATKTCYITTPYFLPTRRMRKAIINAKKRGCDVRILTTGVTTSDVPLMRLGSIPVYGKFLAHGIKLYEYNGRTLHAKTLTVDGICSSIGSYNFDRMSFSSNLEIGLIVLDPKTARNIEDKFKDDLAQSTELTYEQWRQRPLYIRIFGWLLYNAMRLIGP